MVLPPEDMIVLYREIEDEMPMPLVIYIALFFLGAGVVEALHLMGVLY